MKTIQFTVSDPLSQRLKDAAWRRRKTQADTLRDILDENLPPSTAVSEDPKVEGEAAR